MGKEQCLASARLVIAVSTTKAAKLLDNVHNILCMYAGMHAETLTLSLLHAGLIDFGQSKQLTEEQRLAFARLVIALSRADGAELLDVVKALDVKQQEAISQGLEDIGIK